MSEFDERPGSWEDRNDAPDGDDPGADLTPAQIAGYLAGELPPDERAEVEAHLAICRPCREELAEVSRLAERSREKPANRFLTYGAPIAAAAVLLLFVARGLDDGSDSGVLRGPDAVTETSRLEVVSPLGQPSATEAVEFVWRSAGEAEYTLILSDAAGRILWRTPTTDTVAGLPDDIILEPGATYYWRVDAALPDGGTMTTGARPLRP